jgi:hypothetical protein
MNLLLIAKNAKTVRVNDLPKDETLIVREKDVELLRGRSFEEVTIAGSLKDEDYILTSIIYPSITRTKGHVYFL